MLKISLGLINLAGILIYSLFTQDVSVSDNTPVNLAPGESVVVEVRISKSEISGFAKLQLELPEGLTASPIETKGASFTFSQQKAKFIWMTLPESPEIIIKYNLVAAASAQGSKTISGFFSYIDDNDRIDYSITPRTVLIGGEAPIVENVGPDSIAAAELENLNANSNPTTLTEVSSESVINENCYREITDLGNGNFQVKVTITGLEVEGYAKIQEKLPPTFTLSGKKSGGSVVTVDGSTIKFVWFQTPDTEKLNVIYNAKTSGTLPLDIDGAFSYVLDNKPTSVKIETVGSSVVEEPLAEQLEEVIEENIEEVEPVAEVLPVSTQINAANSNNTSTSNNTSINNSPESVAEAIEEVIEEEPVTETASIETEVVVNKVAEQTPSRTSIPNPETGVSYRVQIVAGPNTVGKTYFKSRHNFSENFVIENHDGWVKYTTGSHNEYKKARDSRERIGSAYNFDGPFVAAYNEGERITVQEALMITSQNWTP